MAFATLHKAIRLDPENEDILDRQRAAMLAQGPFASAGYRFRSTKEANENFGRFTGQAAINPTIGIGIDVENDHLASKGAITRVNGTAQRFSDNRQRGTLTLDKMYNNGDEATAALYANNNTPGGGAQFSRWDRQGAT